VKQYHSEAAVAESARARSTYLIESVLRACDLLEAFQFEGELVRLRELVSRTGMNKTTAFRLLTTLAERGLVERVGAHQYRSAIKPLKRKKYRLGYCALSSDFSFSRDITEGLIRAAADEKIDLVTLNNEFNSKLAVRNADLLIREKVDLVFEHQGDEHVSAVVSSKFIDAGIPMIAIHVPHPGATYFGPDNYNAGLMGGRYLGRWVKQSWQGQVDYVIFLELPRAGLFPRSRLTGTLVGAKEALPELDDSRVLFLNGQGRYGPSLEAVRKHVRRRGAGRTLVCGINDPSTIGGIRAFEEAGAGANCAGLGHGASIEARAELRRPRTPLIASVGYFPESYGEPLIQLALQILGKKSVPPATFIKPKLVLPTNVDHYYPTDPLRSQAEMTTLLLGGTA
jgi:ribose transport system substrate-binding protein